MSLIQPTNTGAQRAAVRPRGSRARLPVNVRLKAPTNGNGAAQTPAAPRAKDAIPPFKMPKFRAPRFPRRTFDIRDFGAIPDDTCDCTHAIKQAIAACGQAGGGRVVIPKGTWFTGPIHLASNVNLHIEDGATVRFSDDPQQYLPPVFVRWAGQECFNFSPLIYARDCSNIAITGRGTLLGQGQKWWRWQKAEQRINARLYQMVVDGVPVEQRRFGSVDEPLRPQFILAINCTDVLLEDFTIAQGGPLWTVHVAYCQNVCIRGLEIDAAEGPNNDGIVIDSSRSVVIEDCDLASSDDCVSLKSGMNEDGWRVNKPTENVIVRRVRATKGQGGMTIGSDMSGGVRNVFVHDCAFDGPHVGIRFKAARGRGGVVEDVYVQDIEMGRIGGDAIQLTTEYKSFAKPDGKAPVFRNIRIRNVTCKDAATAARMVGLPDAPLRDFILQNITIAAQEGLYCASANGIHLLDVRVTPRIGPVLALKDSRDVIIDGLNQSDHGGVFLDLRGRQTKGVRLRGESRVRVRPAVVLGIDVPRDALVHE
jgi:hypothetical protein